MTMGSSGDESEPGTPPVNFHPIVKRSRAAKGAAKPNFPNVSNAPKQILDYHRILVEFMSYNDGQEYPLDKVFTE